MPFLFTSKAYVYVYVAVCARTRKLTLRLSSQLAKNGVVLGMMRETYDKWERRAPLCPQHVERLLGRGTVMSGSSSEISTIQKILVQPSTNRIFTDTEYERAGALVQEDITGADLILGVKRPLKPESLKPEKAYMFFSHVIKGQPENMDLLHYVLENKIRLFDYECIVDGGEGNNNCKQKRLVAFGKYAGMAGMHDGLHALGRHLLNQGYSTPFLNIPQTYVHSDFDDMRACLEKVGENIASGRLMNMEPLVFCVTGKGNVALGALDVLKLLPSQHITVEDLQRIHANPSPHKCIYILSLGTQDLFQHKYWRHFDRDHYQKNPFEYESVFHSTIAPHISVLVNGMYWDERFPRILTKDQMKDIHEGGKKKLLVVSDISCDVNGSIEFLDRTTSIDNPFFEYDPSQKREVKANGNGITVCGVDILPTEMPRESSSHFGDALCPILEDYAGMNADEIPPVLENACIASGGELTPGYRYIQTLIGHSHHKKVKKSDLSMTLWLEGHLFDSGLINQVLDIIESHECGFEIKECRFRQTNGSTRKSKLVLGVSGETASALMSIETKIRILIKVIHKAQATMTRYNDNGVHGEPSSTSALTVESPVEQKVLIFGSGLVSESLVEYLGRRGNRQILVVSDDEDRARIVAQKARRGSHIGLNMTTVGDFELSELVKDADIVVSVLPAKMHPHVARACIGQRTDLVTASYESEEMRGLDIAARQAGISLVNEVGLDPGLDHMSAMKIIDDIHERGGTVTVFESLCGGLPAPEASDNPLRYKFSWSPMGVLSACQNAACYRRDGQIINVSGEDLLDSAETFLDVWSELELEALPNRNSLPYAGIYGIESARTVFRGTLRFGGFSSLMYTFRKMGLFDPSNAAASTWKEVISAMELPAEAIRARECLEWLGMLDSTPLACPESVMQSFCSVLEDKLKLQRHERDLVLMHHLIKASFEDGCSEVHRSSLQVFGDDKMTAMSKTVGYTVAATTELVLDGLLTKKGLILPTTPEIYNPILAALAKEGVTFNEFVEKT